MNPYRKGCVGWIKTTCHDYKLIVLKYNSYCIVIVDNDITMFNYDWTNTPIEDCITIYNKSNIPTEFFRYTLFKIFDNIALIDLKNLIRFMKRNTHLNINNMDGMFFEEGMFL